MTFSRCSCRWLAIIAGLVLAACNAGSGTVGSEGNACYGNNTCDDGLTCAGGTCVAASGGNGGSTGHGGHGNTTSTIPAGGAGGKGGSAGTGGTGTTTQTGSTSATNSPPQIVVLGTNVASITEGESATFTAVVTDPDGVDDVIGGTLRDPGGAIYGAFVTSSQEGA